MTYQIEKQ